MLLHGFTQTGASWAPLLPDLEAAGHTVATPDVPAGVDLDGAAAELAGQLGRAVWAGYSMGGRLALHVALGYPEAVDRLVLVSATAGIEDPMDRAVRREQDEVRAETIERVGVEAFLERWLAQPMFASLPVDAAGLEARRSNTVERLASHLRLMGTGTQLPSWSRLCTLEMPVLVVAGERDAKFVALAHRLVDAIGDNARLHVVEGAGHACHLERPAAFNRVLLPFL